MKLYMNCFNVLHQNIPIYNSVNLKISCNLNWVIKAHIKKNPL